MPPLPALCPLARTSGGVSTSGRTPECTWKDPDNMRLSSVRQLSFSNWVQPLVGSHRRVCGRRGLVSVRGAVAVDYSQDLGQEEGVNLGSRQAVTADTLDFFYTESGQREWVCPSILLVIYCCYAFPAVENWKWNWKPSCIPCLLVIFCFAGLRHGAANSDT
jgi:hypothetical protein